MLGVICAAAGLEEITLHPTHELALPFRVMLFGGLAMVALGVVGAIWRAFGVIPKERLVGASAITALLLAAHGWDGIVLLVVVDVVVFVILVIEHRRVEGA